MKALELARELVRRHSVSDSSTVEIGNFVSNQLESAGFKVRQQPYTLGNTAKVNVIAIKGEGEPKLALSGHLDTVPYDASKWLSDPLTLAERDGKYFGMGICDMKGFLAVAMAAGMQIPPSELARPFALIFTSDEEVGCIGARRLTKELGKVSDMYVIGEPTEMRPVYLHKGYMFMRVTLTGARGHSSDPKRGKNVIERALPTVLQRLEEFRHALENIVDPRLDPPYPTTNIGRIDTGAGSAKNVIADYCALDFDIRPVPGQDPPEIIDALQKHVAPDGEINGIKVKIAAVRAPSHPFLTDPDEEIVRAAVAMTGNQPVSTAFNTEGGVFNRAGAKSVICGIGSIKQAHQPNEYLEARYLQDSVTEIYERLIRRLCGKETYHA